MIIIIIILVSSKQSNDVRGEYFLTFRTLIFKAFSVRLIQQHISSGNELSDKQMQ